MRRLFVIVVGIACSLACARARPNQSPPHRLLGAYYFGGWNTALTSQRQPLEREAYSERRPLGGILLDTPERILADVRTAADAGIDFMVYEWYFSSDRRQAQIVAALNGPVAVVSSGRSVPLPAALLYVNHPPFTAGYGEWHSLVDSLAEVVERGRAHWLLVDGRLPLIVFDPRQFAFDVAPLTAEAALAELRTAIRRRSGVALLLGASFNTAQALALADSGKVPAWFRGYDFITAYHFGFLAPGEKGVPLGTLTDSTVALFRRMARSTAVPVVPAGTVGWDPRPWRSGDTTAYYSPATLREMRSLGDSLAALGSRCTDSNRLGCIAVLYAWNEYGEGGYLAPTVPDPSATRARAVADAYHYPSDANVHR